MKQNFGAQVMHCTRAPDGTLEYYRFEVESDHGKEINFISTDSQYSLY
jgi:hypothetical protein